MDNAIRKRREISRVMADYKTFKIFFTDRPTSIGLRSIVFGFCKERRLTLQSLHNIRGVRLPRRPAAHAISPLFEGASNLRQEAAKIAFQSG